MTEPTHDEDRSGEPRRTDGSPPGGPRPPLVLAIGDGLRLRRPHPCGGAEWTVRRVGADIGLVCDGCGRRLLLERPELERRLAAILPGGTT